jgi:hypothetical protein
VGVSGLVAPTFGANNVSTEAAAQVVDPRCLQAGGPTELIELVKHLRRLSHDSLQLPAAFS